MIPADALVELLDRVCAKQGAAVLITGQELGSWPDCAVAAFKHHGLLTKAPHATSAVCSGCERDCVMPVHVLTANGRKPAAMIVCDKRSDVNRVAVPLDHLEQWQSSGDAIAAVLADALNIARLQQSDPMAKRWEVGLLRGTKHASHLVLLAQDRLMLSFAGHVIALDELLTITGSTLEVDKRKLIRLVDRPVDAAGDRESAAERRARLKRRESELKRRGVKAFLKTIAEEEGISIPRVKQLLSEKTS